jgi:hypothetical protein
MKRLLLITTPVLLCFLLLQKPAHAQDGDKLKIKFGKITPDDFKPTAYAIDSNANAVIIADVGSAEIVGNNKGWFSLVFKNYRRAHILNKNGYDIAEVQIELYTNGEDEEELENLKAITYNLEGGKVVETKLDAKSGVFKEKLSKNRTLRKFTFPNIKPGSIIEYEYKTQSDFLFNLQPWDFQGLDYPRLWSEYNVAMPEFYNYVTLSQGYQQFAVKDQKVRRENFSVSDVRTTGPAGRSTFTSNVTDFRWVMKNVPALKEENYTSTLRNHISKVEFQLASTRDPLTPRNYMENWASVSRDLLQRESFGLQLGKDNGWLNDVMDEAGGKSNNKMDKARSIYNWVRDHFTCTSYNGVSLTQNLRNVLKSRNGNEAEINLLLIAMLRKADIPADPVMLSTRSNGYAHAVYPLLNRINYVIARVILNDSIFYLDASRPRIGFGKLHYECYNTAGQGHVISETPSVVDLNSESLRESKVTTLFVINDDKGNIIGTMQQTPGYYESMRLRNRYSEEGKEAFTKSIQKGMGIDAEIENVRIDSINNYDQPVGLVVDFKWKPEDADIIYFNPMMGEGFKENPFKSTERFYPVEMPYTMDQVYTMQLEIPAGFVVDEMPTQTLVKLNEEGDAAFEYRISTSGNTIMLRSRLIFKRAFFDPEEYDTLREFFNLIVKKHNEQIVFKKKK